MTDTESSNTDPMAAARQLLGTEPAVEAEATGETNTENAQTEESQSNSETNSGDTGVVDEDTLLEESSQEVSAYDRPGRWFVVHTQSGYEKKVKQNLEARVQSFDMEDKIYEVVVPMEDVTEFRNGQRVVVQKKDVPGLLANPVSSKRRRASHDP